MGESLAQRAKRLAEEKHRSDEAHKISIRAFCRGSAYGVGTALAASLVMQRYSASFRALRLPVKAAFLSMAFFGAGTFASEHALYRINRPELKPLSTDLKKTVYQRLIEHKTIAISTVIGTSVLGAGFLAMRNNNLGGTQKIMNVRLYGQIAGIAAIVMMMALTAAEKETRKNPQNYSPGDTIPSLSKKDGSK